MPTDRVSKTVSTILTLLFSGLLVLVTIVTVSQWDQIKEQNRRIVAQNDTIATMQQRLGDIHREYVRLERYQADRSSDQAAICRIESRLKASLQRIEERLDASVRRMEDRLHGAVTARGTTDGE